MSEFLTVLTISAAAGLFVSCLLGSVLQQRRLLRLRAALRDLADASESWVLHGSESARLRLYRALEAARHALELEEG